MLTIILSNDDNRTCTQVSTLTVVNVFVLLSSFQVFPDPLLPSTYVDPQNPNRTLGRSELERRGDYIQQLNGMLGEEHPLVQLVCQCLHNIPDQRPTADELLQQLEAAKAQVEGPYGQIVKVDLERVRVLREKDTQIRRLQQQVQQLEVDSVYRRCCVLSMRC